MDLRNKTLIILGALFILAFLLLSGITYTQIQHNYVDFDERTAKNDVERAVRALDQERGNLVITLLDWAEWDDTYQFMSGKDPEYIERNLNYDALANLELNFVIFTDTSGTVYYQKWLDYRSESEMDVQVPVFEALNRTPGLLDAREPSIPHSGLVATDNGPVLVAATSVLNSVGEGPSRGTMVIGRFLDDREMADLSTLTALPLQLTGVPGDYSSSGMALKSGISSVKVKDDRNLTGSLLIPDLSGQRYLLLEVISPREFYASGGSALLEFFLIFTVVNLVFVLILLFFIDRYILARLGLLTSRVNEISGETDDVPDFSVPGNDELSMLGNSLNLMIHRLRDSGRRVRESEERFRLFIRDFPGTIFVKDHDSRFLMVSQQAVEIFHLPPEKLLGKTTSEIFPPDDADRYSRREQEVLALPPGEYREYTDETEFMGRDMTFTTFLFPIRREGDAPLLGGFSMDVTQMRMEQEALLRAHKKLKLLSNITRHDITNKISLLLAYGQIMREHAAEDPQMMNLLQKQSSAVNAIRHQIEFTKDYQEMGFQAPRWQKASLILVYAASHLDFSHVGLKNRLGNLELFADPMLEKVFYNLLENSLQHGTHTTRIQVDYQETEDSCRILFEDDGIGIHDDRKELIFGSEFGREKGLGLYLVREVLGITGITIREVGTFGHGAKFEIRIPPGKFRFSNASVENRTKGKDPSS